MSNNKKLLNDFLIYYNIDKQFYNLINKYNIRLFYSNIYKTYWNLYQYCSEKEFKSITLNDDFSKLFNLFKLKHNKIFKKFIRFIKENNQYQNFYKNLNYDNLINLNPKAIDIFIFLLNNYYEDKTNYNIWKYLQTKWITNIKNKKIYDINHNNL